MTFLYIVLIIVICNILITTIKLNYAHKKELSELEELFDDSTN